MKRKIVLGWLKIVIGLFVFSFGVHLTIFANIGLAPWDCLGMGISYHTPLSYGVSMMVIALVVLGVDLIMREKIGYGTIIDALLTGNFIQFFNDINPLPLNENMWLGISIMLAGFVFMALGLTGYVHGGCSPIGMKKQFRTFIHETAAAFEKMFVSAGKVGFQIELSPQDLISVTRCEVADIILDGHELRE